MRICIYIICLPSMRDRAEWQVAHNSTDKNKATPLILVIFYKKHSLSRFCKCLMCKLVSYAERVGLYACRGPREPLDLSKYNEFAILFLALSSRGPFEMTYLLSLSLPLSNFYLFCDDPKSVCVCLLVWLEDKSCLRSHGFSPPPWFLPSMQTHDTVLLHF